MSTLTPNKQDGFHYQIIVKGYVKENWSQWLGNILIEPINSNHEGPMTKFTGYLVDQAALRGLMNQIWDLNLILISFQTLGSKLNGEEGDNNEIK